MKAFRSVPLSICGVLTLVFALPGFGQSTSTYEAVRGMDERFRIDIGGFFQTFDTTVQLYRPNGTPGNEWNVDDFLGKNANQTTIRIDGVYRFGRHGNLQFGYRGWSKSNDHILSKDIEFEDNVYHVGAQVSSKISQNIGQLYYGYSFVNNGELELGAMLGFAAYYNKFSISGSASIGGAGGGGAAAASSANSNFLAPIPAIGAYGSFTILQRFFVFARVKGLPKITISNRSADMIDVSGGLDYYFTKNVGIGGGYEYINIVYEHPVPGGVHIDMKYSGPLVYLTLAF